MYLLSDLGCNESTWTAKSQCRNFILFYFIVCERETVVVLAKQGLMKELFYPVVVNLMTSEEADFLYWSFCIRNGSAPLPSHQVAESGSSCPSSRASIAGLTTAPVFPAAGQETVKHPLRPPKTHVQPCAGPREWHLCTQAGSMAWMELGNPFPGVTYSTEIVLSHKHLRRALRTGTLLLSGSCNPCSSSAFEKSEVELTLNKASVFPLLTARHCSGWRFRAPSTSLHTGTELLTLTSSVLLAHHTWRQWRALCKYFCGCDHSHPCSSSLTPPLQ